MTITTKYDLCDMVEYYYDWEFGKHKYVGIIKSILIKEDAVMYNITGMLATIPEKDIIRKYEPETK